MRKYFNRVILALIIFQLISCENKFNKQISNINVLNELKYNKLDILVDDFQIDVVFNIDSIDKRSHINQLLDLKIKENDDISMRKVYWDSNYKKINISNLEIEYSSNFSLDSQSLAFRKLFGILIDSKNPYSNSKGMFIFWNINKINKDDLNWYPNENTGTIITNLPQGKIKKIFPSFKGEYKYLKIKKILIDLDNLMLNDDYDKNIQIIDKNDQILFR